MILNLLNPLNSDVKYKRFTFPDGQDHIELSSAVSGPVTIVTRLTNASDLFVLLQVTELLRHLGVKTITLKITYLLAARMDRRMTPNQPITLKIVANLINQQNYDYVEIFDPHSEVSLTLIDRSASTSTVSFVRGVLGHVDVSPYLVAPDAGAARKTEALAQEFNLDVIHGTKDRSKLTGYIANVKIDVDDIKQKTCLVVDDICDGGATFTALAKVLKEHNAGKLYLAVSHGIFSKGADVLSDYERIFTTNSYKVTHHPKITTYNLW